MTISRFAVKISSQIINHAPCPQQLAVPATCETALHKLVFQQNFFTQGMDILANIQQTFRSVRPPVKVNIRQLSSRGCSWYCGLKSLSEKIIYAVSRYSPVNTFEEVVSQWRFTSSTRGPRHACLCCKSINNRFRAWQLV